VQEILKQAEWAERPAGHPAHRDAKENEKTDEINGYGPDYRVVLKGSYGTGKNRGGAGVAIQSGDTEALRGSLPDGARGNESLQVSIGDADTQEKLGNPSEKKPMQGSRTFYWQRLNPGLAQGTGKNGFIPGRIWCSLGCSRQLQGVNRPRCTTVRARRR